MDLLIDLLIILVFLVLKGFFSGSEIAMVNSDKLKLRHMAKMGDRGAQKVLNFYKTPDIILGTTLVGTNIATVTISTLGALIFIDLFGAAGDILAVLLFTPFLLILGEIVPKSVYQQRADVIATYIIYPLRFFSILYAPVIFVFSRIARLFTRLVGGNVQPKSGFITREELRTLLEISETPATNRRFDREKVRRIIRFADTTVGEAIIPLAEVVGISDASSTADAMNTVWRTGFNRLPVYDGNMNNIHGVLTLDTWALLDSETEHRPLADFIQPALYVSPKQTIDQVLPLLQSRPRDHLAVVVDEFGSATGILTMEDIFEEVVGEIDVGYDFEEYQPKKRHSIQTVQPDLSYLVDGRTPITQINDQLHLSLPADIAHTVGGLMVARLRQIPTEGSRVKEDNVVLIAQEVSNRCVNKVLVELA
ncbi:MAG: HlyC/CorC family transporter [Magnetococcales bacterium]|nr:HlyC/CorC family transporter [Magnetococcales bacterium]